MKRALLGVCLLGSISCGDMVRQGTGSSYLIVTALEARSGADESAEFTGVLRSDVITLVDEVRTTFDDPAVVTFQLAMKDPGPEGSATAPTPNNFITVNRYRVEFIRADGRNTPGVDVPYAFDGAFTVTVADTAQMGFTLVRHQAKSEGPLTSLRDSAAFISTIARVTFYGRDQTGREVMATAQISVNFADFGDPD